MANRQNGRVREDGFSMVELLIVVAIGLIVTALALPNVVQAVRNLKLSGACSDYVNMLQQARIHAVHDNRAYAVRLSNLNGNPIAYADICPQNADGTSGNGTYDAAACATVGGTNVSDLLVMASTDIITDDTDANAAALQTAFNKTVTNGAGTFQPANSDPIFGPRGTPCTSPNGAAAGIYCPSSGAAVTYYKIFKSSKTNQIEGITIDAAGRIQKWGYNGTTGVWTTI